MKHVIIFVLLTLLSNNTFAQKEYNTWYFGDRAGLTFNTNQPTALTDGVMYTIESSSSICDEQGNLLFYTEGDTVWNKHHQYMKNEIGSTYFYHATSSQGSVIVKKPGSDHLYYIFCSRSEPSYSTDFNVRYWLIDMNSDNGNGEVIKMNVPLPLWNPLECLSITGHANGTDIWVGAYSAQSGLYSMMRTVQGELDTTNITATDLGIKAASYFPSKFSPDSKILLSYRKEYVFTFPDQSFEFRSKLYLHHFNNSTGWIYDNLEIDIDDQLSMAIEFSHNSQYLYVTNEYGETYQYDLSNWNKQAIEQSLTHIYHNPDKPIIGLQLGPDKKIYAFHLYTENLTVIEKPWLKGSASVVTPEAISTKGRKNEYGAPYYPTFVFKKYWDKQATEYYVPNAFSPNGDGVNDVFTLNLPDIEGLSIQIFNRWGQKVFDAQSLDAAWDGKLDGKPCLPDVYTYTIIITDKIDETVNVQELSGNLTLLR